MRLCGFAALAHPPPRPLIRGSLDATAPVHICISAHPGTYQAMHRDLCMRCRHGRRPGVASRSHAALVSQGVPVPSMQGVLRLANHHAYLDLRATHAAPGIAEPHLSVERMDGKVYRG